MSKKQFEASPKVYKMVKEMVSDVEQFHPLIDVVDHIAIVMKEVKPPKDPTKHVIVGKTAKAPPVMEAIGSKDWKFIITLNSDVWEQYTEDQKTAELDHQLCYMSVTVADDGEYKYGLNKPDVVGFEGEFKRHGFWRGTPGGEKSPIEDLLDVDEDD